MDADAVIAALNLVPHPEGGLYRQTWSDPAGTAIYFLLRPGAGSAWHRVHGRAEIWHFYAGATVALTLSEGSPGDPASPTTVLGIDLEAGERPQAIVPAGWWQCARTLGEWSLVGCTVAPPFSFDVFEMAPGH
jgi:predicted cupin superfamily sugar epimerase